MEYIYTNDLGQDIYEQNCPCGKLLTGTQAYLRRTVVCFLCCKIHHLRKPCRGCTEEETEAQLEARRIREAGYRIDRHEQVRAKETRRKDRVKAAGGDYLINYDEMYQAQNGRCYYCHRTIEEIASKRYTKLTCDHILPVSKGGTNDSSNLVLCCQTCNASKGDKLLDDWMKSKYYKANCM